MIVSVGAKLLGMTLALPNSTNLYIHRIKNYDGYEFVDKIQVHNINTNLTATSSLSSTSTRTFIRFGTSNVAETIEDYTLTEEFQGTNINNYLTIDSRTISESVSNNTLHYIFTATNTGSAAITIREVGVLVCLGGPITVDGVSRRKNFLHSRFVISDVVLQPSEQHTFNVAYSFN